MCTAIYVGKNITTDGSVLLARCEDDGIERTPILKITAPQEFQSCRYKSKDWNGTTDFQYPFPRNAFGMIHVPDWPHDNQHVRSCIGINEAGLTVSATQTIFASEKALSVDPYVTSGMTEDDLTNFLLQSNATADDAVDFLGKAIETEGVAEGMAAFIADKHHQWWFETGSGHQWMARLLPEDRYMAYANQGRLTRFRDNDPSCKGSPDLIEFALRNHLLCGNSSEPFNFTKSYSRNDYRDSNYNLPRVREIERILGTNGESLDEGIFQTPSKKVSLVDLRSLLRNYYCGTEHDPYSQTLRGNEKWRPISIFRTTSAHIVRIRPWLPPEIGEMFYLAFGMPLFSVFLPVYSGLKNIPTSFSKSPSRTDSESAYWKFRKLQTLAMVNFSDVAKDLIREIESFESLLASKEKIFEKEYLSERQNQPFQANQLLEKYSFSVFNEALQFVENLTNELLHDLTIRTNEKIMLLNGLSSD